MPPPRVLNGRLERASRGCWSDVARATSSGLADSFPRAQESGRFGPNPDSWQFKHRTGFHTHSDSSRDGVASPWASGAAAAAVVPAPMQHPARCPGPHHRTRAAPRPGRRRRRRAGAGARPHRKFASGAHPGPGRRHRGGASQSTRVPSQLAAAVTAGGMCFSTLETLKSCPLSTSKMLYTTSTFDETGTGDGVKALRRGEVRPDRRGDRLSVARGVHAGADHGRAAGPRARDGPRAVTPPAAQARAAVTRRHQKARHWDHRQGLTLVRFSAQLELFLTNVPFKHPAIPPNTPQTIPKCTP